MDTYRRIKQQIAELEKKAAELRRAEAAKVIVDIKKKIAKFELQPEDLFGENVASLATSSRPKRDQAVARVKTAPKFMDPVSGKTWSGRGKAPNWIAGRNRDAFLIDSVTAQVKPSKKAVPVKVSKAASTSTPAEKRVTKVAKNTTRVSKPARNKTALKSRPKAKVTMVVAPQSAEGDSVATADVVSTEAGESAS